MLDKRLQSLRRLLLFVFYSSFASDLVENLLRTKLVWIGIWGEHCMPPFLYVAYIPRFLHVAYILRPTRSHTGLYYRYVMIDLRIIIKIQP